MNLTSFIRAESGAVTVDWVVLTAALVGLGMATTAVVSGGVSDLSSDIDTQLVNQGIITEFASASASIDWGAYAPISPQHGASWGAGGFDAEGRSWAENTYDGWSQLDDAQLIATYSQNYTYATTQATGSMETQTRADYVAVAQQIMMERGLEIPAGNQSAEEIRNTF